MQLQKLMWKVAMVFLVILLIVNMGVHASAGNSCSHGRCDGQGDTIDEMASLSDALESVSNEW